MISYTFLIFAPSIVFALTFALIHWMLTSDRVRLALDHPNSRSLHTAPIPRTGGLAIILAVLPAAAILAPSYSVALVGTAALAIVSFVDDVRGISVVWRLLAHLLAAIAVAISYSPVMSLPALLPCVLAVVWITNLYNFMDGSDGLAGGMTIIGFGVYAIASALFSDWSMAALCLCIAGAALAFLCFNFHPARIFLGDVGSIPLGFLAASVGLIGWRHGAWPLWFPVIVFAPFIFDATLTLARRLKRREAIWRAHRSHYYQRLVQLGWGHRKTAFAEYLIMALCGVSSLWALNLGAFGQFVFLMCWVLTILGLAFAVDRAWQMHTDIARE